MPDWVEVLGVVAHQRNTSLAEPGREQIYFTDAFKGHGYASRWAIRTVADPNKFVGPVRAQLAKVHSLVVPFETVTMQALVEQSKTPTRFWLLLIGIFAAVAAALAAIGLYGVLSTAMRQRTAEIGVRMALGATPSGIFRLVVLHGFKLTGAGILIGVFASLALTRFMLSMLVGIEPTDPITFATMTLVFFLIAGLACWLPARRASSLDPATALRAE